MSKLPIRTVQSHSDHGDIELEGSHHQNILPSIYPDIFSSASSPSSSFPFLHPRSISITLTTVPRRKYLRPSLQIYMGSLVNTFAGVLYIASHLLFINIFNELSRSCSDYNDSWCPSFRSAIYTSHYPTGGVDDGVVKI
ncbi:hypothetical protein L211DRAFT_685414 [Terfezia boudieri ATCC MYA-4762]|uniref:Uncharacterized protein n=1 Tax=Terfezia boudieri ATCC MYA-4762 TaxID=1051890 RepID=A0A3N4LUS4_9PEZI|nr:hypothetical protein L211DRAFT_685414 [Terfezia boudieri ATCC MYA-4762]